MIRASKLAASRPLIGLVAVSILSACGIAPPREPALPAPSLKLLDSAPLELADGCSASGSYIVGFTVDSQGRTTDIRPPAAPPCLQDALHAWVASFRYAPPGAAIAGSVEWLLVTAPKGS